MTPETPGGQGVLDWHAVVTFTLEGVMDLRLDGFSHQNVIMGLVLRRAPDRLERHGYLSATPLPGDVEFELKPCFGMSGLIRAHSVAITLDPAPPE